MAFHNRIFRKKKKVLVLYGFPILLIVLHAISDSTPKITMNDLLSVQSVTSVEVFFPLDEKNPVLFSEEEAGALLRLLSSVRFTPISEEEIPLYYGGPLCVRLCSDRGTVTFRICERKCSFENGHAIRYYYDLSGSLEEAEAYALRVLRDVQ